MSNDASSQRATRFLVRALGMLAACKAISVLMNKKKKHPPPRASLLLPKPTPDTPSEYEAIEEEKERVPEPPRRFSRRAVGAMTKGPSAGRRRKQTCSSLMCGMPRVAWHRKCVVVLVGLPARGKSFIAKKLLNFLTWEGTQAKLFNVGMHRRKSVPAEDHKANFFDPENKAAAKIREEMAFSVLEELLEYLVDGGDVAIFDATNTTRARREAVKQMIEEASTLLKVVFVESICNDPKVVERNLKAKVTNSPDYRGVDPQKAYHDFKRRVAMYERVYETIEERENLAFIKIINLRSQIICNGIYGRLPQHIAVLLMSWHVYPRPIYLTRAGHCPTIGDQTLYLDLHHALDAAKAKTAARTKTERHQLPCSSTSGSPHPSSKHNDHGQMLGMGPPPEMEGEDMEAPAAFVQRMKQTGTMHAMLSKEGKRFSRRLAGFMRRKTQDFLDSTLDQEAESESHFLDELRRTTTELFGHHHTTHHHPSCLHHQEETSEWRSPVDSRRRLSVFETEKQPVMPLIMFTSTLNRAQDTASCLAPQALQSNQLACLNILNTGAFYNKTPEEILQNHPEEVAAWVKNPFVHRFPEGESQLDQARKLVPLVMEMERQVMPVLVVSHSSTLQILHGYFMGASLRPAEYSRVTIPLHTVVELLPTQYGWKESRYYLGDGCEDDPEPESVAHDTDFYREPPAEPESPPQEINDR